MHETGTGPVVVRQRGKVRPTAEALLKGLAGKLVMTFGEQVAKACGEFGRTLAHFGQPRGLLEAEKFAIGRAIQVHGFEAVLMALIGARFEPKSDRFDPADWVNLDRYLMAKNFKRFVGLGAKQVHANKPRGRPAVDWGPQGPPEGHQS